MRRYLTGYWFEDEGINDRPSPTPQPGMMIFAQEPLRRDTGLIDLYGQSIWSEESMDQIGFIRNATE